MANAFGIVTSYGRDIHVDGLEDYRPIGAFSFLGRYRVIDFAISNMTNSGIETIQVHTGRNPRPLIDHLGTGRQYNINSKTGRLQIFFSQNAFSHNNYDTDVNSYLENMRYIKTISSPYVVIAPSYMIYTEDYSEFIDAHITSGADVSMLYHSVDNAKENYLECHYLELNRQKGVISVKKNNATAKSRNIFMETYVMKKEIFIDLVQRAHATSSMYTLADMINDVCESEELDVRGVPHRGYFAAITSLKSYYDANIALNDYVSVRNLIREEWPIYTKTNDSCPTRYFAGADVKSSLIANGSCIHGTVENSIVGRGVHIAKGAVVKNCVVLAGARIGEDAYVENQVIDKRAHIEKIKEVVSEADDPGYVRRDDVI